ncbi:Gfo/Idh/MocA family oxidoreductase [Adhaeretor mobilis]|uniref:Oxidoreductase YteT n=1 Tax=Adhaeretor mobilis TaxID=1930276 RepID=A0A517MPW6_9BACT|nr:Gfo/Idh/MocA family oxidoreductase [Adhaeretor mobilis]QDS96912.1 Putative oxidoreductase YteT precursor [Adhaeretor mobilis]
MPTSSTKESRREFLQSSLPGATAKLTVGATLAAIAPQVLALEATPSQKLRVALVGTGSRGTYMWGESLEQEFPDRVDTVGLCDINPLRVEYAQSLYKDPPAVFTDFETMIRATKPDVVIVTSPDATHAQYAIAAMQLGCDVICEKPLATTAKDCQAIHDAEKQTGKKVIVTFNARYSPRTIRIKELIAAGAIGDIYSVDCSEMLDLDHGASYFRRWHAYKANSGTLLVQKGSHIFDQVNWWLDAEPVEITALGDLRKYGRNGPFRSTHCRGCNHKSECELYWDITKDKRAMQLYVQCEQADGYLRDACLYREDIDIYDTMAVQCRYDNGVMFNYSLNVTSPIEGQIIAFNGSRGRIELRSYHRQPWNPEMDTELRLITNDPYAMQLLTPEQGEGGHGGADPAIKRSVLYPDTPDPLGQRADSRAGIMSSILGIAAVRSIETGETMRVADMIDLS